MVNSVIRARYLYVKYIKYNMQIIYLCPVSSLYKSIWNVPIWLRKPDSVLRGRAQPGTGHGTLRFEHFIVFLSLSSIVLSFLYVSPNKSESSKTLFRLRYCEVEYMIRDNKGENIKGVTWVKKWFCEETQSKQTKILKIFSDQFFPKLLGRDTHYSFLFQYKPKEYVLYFWLIYLIIG